MRTAATTWGHRAMAFVVEAPPLAFFIRRPSPESVEPFGIHLSNSSPGTGRSNLPRRSHPEYNQRLNSRGTIAIASI